MLLLHWQTTERDIFRIALQPYRGSREKALQEHSFERGICFLHVRTWKGMSANKEVPTTKKMIKDEKCDTAYHHIYELGGHQAFKAL